MPNSQVQRTLTHRVLEKNRRAAASPKHAIPNNTELDPASGTAGGGGVAIVVLQTAKNATNAHNRPIDLLVLMTFTFLVVVLCAGATKPQVKVSTMIKFI